MFNNRMSLNLIKTQLDFAPDFLQKNGNKTKDIQSTNEWFYVFETVQHFFYQI